MKANRERWHLFIKPEDDANRQLANGFVESLSFLAQTKVQIDRPAGGYLKALEFVADAQLERFPERRLLILIDFDKSADIRKRIVERYSSVNNRIFVLGAKPEAEDLRRELKCHLCECGAKIADSCEDSGCAIWAIDSLRHNEKSLSRLCPEIYRELIKT